MWGSAAGEVPVGAVVVKDGKIVGRGANRVTAENDPTAHAEVNAIRQATKSLGTFDLSGAEIYTSCEPCPMCLGAIYWARIGKIYYGCTAKDAAEIGFADQFIYDELEQPKEKRKLSSVQVEREACLEAFRAWEQSPGKVPY